MDVAHRTLCESPAPTSVTKCRLPFAKEECIVTANGNKLLIYSTDNNQLTLVWEKRYWADIFGVFCHKTNGKYDNIIIGCDTCKVIIIEAVNDVELKETEFHQFPETDQCTRLRSPTIMVCDPKGTCLALLIGQEKLVLLPLACATNLPDDSFQPDENNSDWKVITKSVIYPLNTEFEKPILRVRDMVFLEGYNRPTLAILYEPTPTWSVRLPVQKSTVCISIVSPPLVVRAAEKNLKVTMWTSRPVPHNSFKLIPVPTPHGGFIVLSLNAILYMTHTNGVAFALNELARLDNELPYDISGQSDEVLEIHSGIACTMDRSHFLITVGKHNFAILTLHDNGVVVTKLSLCVCNDREFHPSVLLHLRENIVFAGSVIHDSELIDIGIHTDIVRGELENLHMTEKQTQIYQEIYGELPAPPAIEVVGEVVLQTLSVVRQLGTVVAACPCVGLQRESDGDRIEMALGTGFRATGAIQLLRTGIAPRTYQQVSQPGTTDLFSSRIYPFLLVSTDSTTTVLRLEQDLPEEHEDIYTVIVRDERTIVASDVDGSFVQVTPHHARVLKEMVDGWTYTEFLSLEDDQDIKYARIDFGYIVIVTQGLVRVFDSQFQLILQVEHRSCFRAAVYDHKLFVLLSSNVIKMYDLRLCDPKHPEPQIPVSFDNFRRFADVILPTAEEAAAQVQGQGQGIRIIDMAFVQFTSMVLFVMLQQDGRAFFYQWIGEHTAFRRLRSYRWTMIEKKAKASIMRFDDINGISGAFVAGASPPFFILEEMGYPRVVPLGSFKVRAFTQANSPYFQSLFVAADEKELRICDISQLADGNHHIIDGCIVERLHIGMTVRKIVYAADWNSLIFSCSTPHPFTHEGELDIDPEAKLPINHQQPITPDREISEEEMTGVPNNTEERYSVIVMNEYGFTSKVEYGVHEIVHSIAIVHTTDHPEKPKPTLKAYLAVGTGMMCDVKLMMRGYLYIYNRMITVNDEGRNEVKLKQLYGKIYKNPITQISECSGYIVIYIGNTMQLLRFYNESGIKAESFAIGKFFASQLTSLKNYLLSVDSFDGFDIFRWRTYGKKLITMARDCVTKLATCGAFLTSGDVLGGVVFDSKGNAQIFDIDEYAIPVDALVRSSIFHINGVPLNAGHFPLSEMVTVEQQEDLDEDKIEDEQIDGEDEGKTYEKQTRNELAGHIAWYVTKHGTFGAFMPIDEAARHRLCLVQAQYNKLLVGLSQTEYRTAKYATVREQGLLVESPRLVVDLDCLIEMAESTPETIKYSVKSNMSEIMATITQIYSRGLDVFVNSQSLTE